MIGLVPFLKPKGITSYDVIRRVKRWTGEQKIGHGGTLDPFAQGVLVLGIGSEGTTQLDTILKGSIKTYRAFVRLGETSTTDDPEGEISSHEVLHMPTPERLLGVLEQFEGEIIQVPPSYSALKLSGVPAYKRVRRGEKIELAPRTVRIESIILLDYTPPDFTIEVTCGSGVYIRALARDIGKALGTGAYLRELIRTRVGRFTIDEAITTDDITRDYIELYVVLKGVVQGIGFRFLAERHARTRSLAGYAKNLPDGSLEVLAQGHERDLQDFLKHMRSAPPAGRIDTVASIFRHPQTPFYDFFIG